jgi:hypothetical protein
LEVKPEIGETQPIIRLADSGKELANKLGDCGKEAVSKPMPFVRV